MSQKSATSLKYRYKFSQNFEINIENINIDSFIGICELQNIEYLTISNSRIKEIPDEILKLKKLKGLIIKDAPLDSISPNFTKLTSLEHFEIYLNRRKPKELPLKLEELQNLRTLYLSGVSIPGGIPILPKLEKLITNDIITESSFDLICTLKHLKELTLYSASIDKIPDNISNLGKLEKLSIYSNNPMSISTEIGNLQSLEQLCLHIKEVPASIGRLKKLIQLDVRGKDLQQLPEEIGNLSKLKSIKIGNTGIGALPDSISNLKSLEVMSVTNNEKLSEIPEGLDTIKDLETMYLYGNHISS